MEGVPVTEAVAYFTFQAPDKISGRHRMFDWVVQVKSQLSALRKAPLDDDEDDEHITRMACYFYYQFMEEHPVAHVALMSHLMDEVTVPIHIPEYYPGIETCRVMEQAYYDKVQSEREKANQRNPQVALAVQEVPAQDCG